MSAIEKIDGLLAIIRKSMTEAVENGGRWDAKLEQEYGPDCPTNPKPMYVVIKIIPKGDSV